MRLALFLITAAVLAGPPGCRRLSRHSSHATEVRFLHAATGVDEVHFVVDGFRRATVRRYEMSDYVRMASGRRILEIWEDRKLIFTALVDIEHGDEQTFTLAGTSGRDLVVVQTLDPDGVSAPGTTRLSFFHASPDGPPLDLEIDGKALLAGVRFLGDHPVPGWITIPSGLRKFTIRETRGGRRRFGPFAFDAVSRRDMTVAVMNANAGLELRAWDDLEARALRPEARIRVLNASPELGPVELLVDGRTEAAGVSFRAASTYRPARTGAHRIEIRSGGIPRVRGTFTPESGVDYTVAVTGTPAAPAALVHPDGPYIADPGTFVFDVFHLGRDAGRVDVRVNGALPASLRNLPFLGSSPPPTPPAALLVDLGRPAERVDTFEAFRAGTATRLDRADLVPAEDGVYSVVLLGNRTVRGGLGVGDTAVHLLLFEEAEDGRALSRFRTGHAAPSRGALTFKVDGALAGDAISPRLTYLGATGVPGDYVHLAPGEHTLVVTPAGSASTVTATRLAVGYGADTTELVLERSVADPTPWLAGVADPDGPFPPAAGRARLRLHHAARGLSGLAFDLHLNGISGAPLIRNVPYGQASAYREVPAGSDQTLILTEAGHPRRVLHTITRVTLGEGRDVSLVALATRGAANLTESVLLADN